MSGRSVLPLIAIIVAAVALVCDAEAAKKRANVPLPRARPVVRNAVLLPRPRPADRIAALLPAPKPHAIVQHVLAVTTAALPASALAYSQVNPSLPAAPTETTSAADRAAVKRAAELVTRNKFADATSVETTIHDPLARKLVEWIILRGDENHSPGFERYDAFITRNPTWPSIGLLRRRAEAALWDNQRDAATVLRYFRNREPLSGKGHLALARALTAHGDSHDAERHVREAWQSDDLSSGVESLVLSTFPHILRPVDYRARMHRRLYAGDVGAGLRAAHHLGEGDRAIAKAWVAVIRGEKNAKALLDDVPRAARQDAGYIFSRVRWLRRHDKINDAARELLSAPRAAAELLDTDQWWIERRVIARDLLEKGDPKTAYRIVFEAATPAKGNYAVEQEFMAGWIALRFLHNPATAMRHFTMIASTTRNPTALARAGYWQGRTAEALGHAQDARSYYSAAARYRSAYYGQIALAKLGKSEIDLPAPPTPSPKRRAVLAHLEFVRALKLLYAVDQQDLAIPFVLGAVDHTQDVGVIVTLAEIAQLHKDARSMLLVGKAAINRGFDLHRYAFPGIGIPAYKPIGPEIDNSILYSVVRQESAFNAKDVSSANAMGLMQVTPEAGRYIARKFHVTFDKHRLLNDMAYNVQMGAAEIGDLIRDYRGSLILAFVGYNAGRGRVRDWIARFGDPRNPKVDPVDWVEKIPFSETRNYVQRLLENLQVYRAKFGVSSRLLIQADLERGKSGH